MSLDPLTCYLRLPGQFPMTRLKLVHQQRVALAPNFIPRVMDPAPDLNTSNSSEDSDSSGTSTSTDTRVASKPTKPKKAKAAKRECEMESIF